MILVDKERKRTELIVYMLICIMLGYIIILSVDYVILYISVLPDRSVVSHAASCVLRHLRTFHPPGGLLGEGARCATTPAALSRFPGGLARTGTYYVRSIFATCNGVH